MFERKIGNMQRKRNQSLSERMRAKEWRALPQNAALRGDTRTSKRRRVRGAARAAAFTLLFCGIIALFIYVWTDMMRGLAEDGGETRVVGVEFSDKDGVLDEAWFRAWTGFDENRAPNLNLLRRRLLAYPQILAADIRRLPEGKIRVFVRERPPIARLADEHGGVSLVADDGVIFPAETFPPAACGALPLLSDAKISTDENTGFERIEGISALTDFLTLARTCYPTIFREWGTISLRDFPSDSHDAAMPWSALRVIPKPLASNPVDPQIREIVFSAEPRMFREDLRLLAAATQSGQLEKALRSAAPRKRDFRMLFITNRKNPAKEFREMRLIPVPEGAE